MGRDTYIHIFIGRKCREEELKQIQEKTENNPDYYDEAYIFELNEDKPFMKIEGYPVIVIPDETGNDIWFICEKYIKTYDIEYDTKIIELNNYKPKNEKHKVLLVSEISI
jgi:hypothetical protein